MRMKFVVLVTAAALLEYVWFGFQVGRARGEYGVDAPAVSGHPIFERYHRVHQNTLENLAIFLPGLWLFATYVNATIAALLGVVFIVGRAVYARLYVQDPPRRSIGVMMSFPIGLILLIGGAIGALLK
jgi:glutathione S-transferase